MNTHSLAPTPNNRRDTLRRSRERSALKSLKSLSSLSFLSSLKSLKSLAALAPLLLGLILTTGCGLDSRAADEARSEPSAAANVAAADPAATDPLATGGEPASSSAARTRGAPPSPDEPPLTPSARGEERSAALVADALATERVSEASGDPAADRSLEEERERLAAERAAQERRRAELEARERELEAREREITERRAAERAAEEAAAAEQRRRDEAAELRRRAQAAELERARRADLDEPRTDVPQAEENATTPTTEQARVVDQREEPAAAGEEAGSPVARAAVVDAGSEAGEGNPESSRDVVLPPTRPPSWTGDEAWRSGRTSEETNAPSASEAAQRLRPGTRFEVEITETISSASARVGDIVSTRLSNDIVDARGDVLVAAGTELRGRVTEVRPLRKVGGRAALGVVIDRIILPNGDEIEIRARLEEFGKDKRSDKFRIAGAAVAGAILGGIFGDAEGAVAGAAAGAAAGTAAVAQAKGEEVELPAGLTLELELEEIVTVREEIGDVVRR